MEPKLYTITKLEIGSCAEQEFFWAGNKPMVNSTYYLEALNIAPDAELKVVEKKNKKETVRTITLSFRTDNDIVSGNDILRKAYKVTTPEGVFLIGGHLPPYPITNTAHVYGGNPKSDKAWQVSVVWTINKPLPKIEQ